MRLIEEARATSKLELLNEVILWSDFQNGIDVIYLYGFIERTLRLKLTRFFIGYDQKTFASGNVSWLCHSSNYASLFPGNFHLLLI